MVQQAAYNFADLVQACKQNEAFVWPPTIREAKFLNLYTDIQIMDFIADQTRYTILYLQNSKPFEKWGGDPPVPMVDAYIFSVGPNVRGYLAFYLVPGHKWNIKSFKRDETVSELQYPFKDYFNKLNDRENMQ